MNRDLICPMREPLWDEQVGSRISVYDAHGRARASAQSPSHCDGTLQGKRHGETPPKVCPMPERTVPGKNHGETPILTAAVTNSNTILVTPYDRRERL